MLLAVWPSLERALAAELESVCAGFADWPTAGLHPEHGGQGNRRGSHGRGRAERNVLAGSRMHRSDRHQVREFRDRRTRKPARLAWSAALDGGRARWQIEPVRLADDGVLRDAEPLADGRGRQAYAPEL